MIQKIIFYMHNYLKWPFIWLILVSSANSQGLPTSSPATEFLSKPVNRTVLEGEPAILRCKIRDLVHTCQWFYLEPGLSFYDDDNTPVLVKEFRPTGDRDCSIKFNKARRVQNGQWLCKGLQVHQRKYIISEPVFLQVIAHEESVSRSTTEEVPQPENIFRLSEDGHIINTELGMSSILECNVDRPIRQCSWIAPSGKRILMKEASSGIARYQVQYNLSDGSCPMYITNVTLPDEGNWRCVVNVQGEVGERVGPLVHLHLSQFGIHHNVNHNKISENEPEEDDNSLQVILIGVSLLLLIIVIVLVFLICKRGTSLLRKRNDEQIEVSPVANQTTNHCTSASKLEPSFCPSFIPTIGLGRHHIQQQQQSVPNHYTRYLDMTGSSCNRDSYMMFPPGTRAPAPVPSRSPLHTDRSSSFSGMSTSLPDSQRTTVSYDNSSFQADPYYIRQGSLYSGSHLYEEIDERQVRLGGPLAEDGEGYMLPRNSNATELQSSPVRDQHPITVDNEEPRRWSSADVHPSGVNSGIINYDVPRESVTPIRADVASQKKIHILNELSNCTPVLV